MPQNYYKPAHGTERTVPSPKPQKPPAPEGRDNKLRGVAEQCERSLEKLQNE